MTNENRRFYSMIKVSTCYDNKNDSSFTSFKNYTIFIDNLDTEDNRKKCEVISNSLESDLLKLSKQFKIGMSVEMKLEG